MRRLVCWFSGPPGTAPAAEAERPSLAHLDVHARDVSTGGSVSAPEVAPLSELSLNIESRVHISQMTDQGVSVCVPCRVPWPCLPARFLATIDTQAQEIARKDAEIERLRDIAATESDRLFLGVQALGLSNLALADRIAKADELLVVVDLLEDFVSHAQYCPAPSRIHGATECECGAIQASVRYEAALAAYCESKKPNFGKLADSCGCTATHECEGHRG